MRAFLLLFLAVAPGWAQDEEDPFALDLDDIDLGGSAKSEAAPSNLSYEGGYSQRSAGQVKPDASISITASVGTVTVYCTDTQYVEARVNYTIEGTEEPPMESYGNSIKVAAWGEVGSGGVKLIAGSRPYAVKNAKIQLSVNVPKESKLKVTSSGDWVQVNGCNGSVTASAGKNGAYVDGSLKSFAVSAGSGDVKVVTDTEVTATSSINASKGNATLVMPLAQNVKLDAKGAAVNVAHNVMGSVTNVSAAGTIGSGGPTVTIRASGDVTVKTP